MARRTEVRIHRLKHHLLMGVLLSAHLPCFAQAPPKYSAPVQLVVQSDDELLRNQFAGLLNQELRRLGDVTIVDEKPDWVVSFKVIRLHNVGDKAAGFAVATHISGPLYSDFLTDCSRFPITCLTGKVKCSD